MSIKVIDLHSEAKFDPAQLVRDGYTGVIFKGGQGQLADVPRVHPEWRGLAHGNGLDVGWYWIPDSRYAPEGQKAAIKSTFPTAYFDELGLWLDCEKPRIDMTDEQYHKTPFAGWPLVESLARGVMAYSGRLPQGIYTAPGAFKLIFTYYGCPKPVLDWFAQMLLWTAQYPWLYVPRVSRPSLYGSWRAWTFWQWREGPDVDLFNGGIEDYLALFPGGHPEQSEDDPAPIPPIGGNVTKGIAFRATNIKAMTAGQTPAVTQLQPGQAVYGILKGTATAGDLTAFDHFYKADGARVALGCQCKAFAGNLALSTEAEPEVTPTPTPDPGAPAAITGATVHMSDGTDVELAPK